MKFTNIVENGITKVMLDLEGLDLLGYKLDSEDTVCVFEKVRDFDFTIVNEFLGSLDEPSLRSMVRILTNMRRCIANSGHDDLAADEYVGKLKLFMEGLFDNASVNLTGNLFNDLYNFSAKYTTPDKVDIGYFKNDRQMLVAASLLSALCVMVIHNFKTHFTDVSEPLQVLYPVFEETIRDSDVDGAKEFVERNRALVSNMDDDPASWVIEGIYINDCMLRKHKLPLPIDADVIENLAQRILSSKTYFSSKRIQEMKEINEAEERQRMKNNKISDTPLTDDEFKEFRKKIEHSRLLSVREILKDTLDVIQFTVTYFIQHDPLVQGTKDIEKDSTYEPLIDSWQKIISNAKSQVDEMDDNELSKIAKHANYVQDAFNLVRMYIPVSMYQCSSQPIMDHEIPGIGAVIGARKLRGYLRKILDIYEILNTPVGQYMGANIEYFSKLRFEELFSGVNGTTHHTRDDLGYEIYNTELRHPHYVYLNEQPLDKVIGDPDVFLKWADENAKDIDKDEFFDFLTRRESEISAYTKLKPSYPNLTTDDKDEICKVFYRWFLKEQAS